MKMKIMVAAILAAISTSSMAQYVGTLPPNIETGFNYTTDSDKFTTNAWTVGAAISNGFGIRYGEQRTRGKNINALNVVDTYTEYHTAFAPPATSPVPSSRKVATSNLMIDTQQTSKEVRATYVNVGEDYDIHGSVGVKQVNSAVSGNYTTRATTTTKAIDGTITGTSDILSTSSVAQSDTTDVLVADVNIRLVLTDSLTIGLAGSRDVVDTSMNTAAATVDALLVPTTGGVVLIPSTKLVIVDTLAVDLDLQISDNLSTFAQIGVAHFSNDNNRYFIHSKTTYTVAPEYGISIFGRLKYQHDDNPSGGNRLCSDSTNGIGDLHYCITPSASYYSPDQRYSASPGIQIRQAHDGLVYTASAEVGKQWTTVVGDTSNATIYSWQLGIQTQPGKRTGNTFGVNLFGTNASQLSGSPNYHWYGLYSWMKVPF